MPVRSRWRFQTQNGSCVPSIAQFNWQTAIRSHWPASRLCLACWRRRHLAGIAVLGAHQSFKSWERLFGGFCGSGNSERPQSTNTGN